MKAVAVVVVVAVADSVFEVAVAADVLEGIVAHSVARTSEQSFVAVAVMKLVAIVSVALVVSATDWTTDQHAAGKATLDLQISWEMKSD